MYHTLPKMLCTQVPAYTMHDMMYLCTVRRYLLTEVDPGEMLWRSDDVGHIRYMKYVGIWVPG